MGESKKAKRIYSVRKNEVERCLRDLFANAIAACGRRSADRRKDKFLREFDDVVVPVVEAYFAPIMSGPLTEAINNILATAAAMHEGEPAPLQAPAPAASGLPGANLNITLAIAEGPRVSKVTRYDDSERITEMRSDPVRA